MFRTAGLMDEIKDVQMKSPGSRGMKAPSPAGCSLRIFRAGIFSVVFLLSAAATSLFAAGNPPLKKISFITAWMPQAQFAGFYAAQEMGLYKKHGLEVTILHGGPDSSPYDSLMNGKADVALFWLVFGIEKRVEGVPLVNIAQIIQRSALMLVAKKSSGIETPRDIAGRKVGLWDEIFQIQPRAFFKKYRIQATIIPQAYSVNLFLRDGVDVTSAMWYNEYHTILNAGYDPDELTLFFFQDHGLSFPEDGLYVLEKKLAEDPGRYAAFVEASFEGWQYAFEHPEEILKIVLKRMKEARIPANGVHQKWMFERMKDLIVPREKGRPMGTLTAEDYGRTTGLLKESGVIAELPSMDSFYRYGGVPREK